MGFWFLLQTTQGTGSSSGIGGLALTLLCMGVLLLLWLLSMWYWCRYYYVRNGIWGALLAAVGVFILGWFAVLAMGINTVVGIVGWRREVAGPCPSCGRKKLIVTGPNQEPHLAQPHCPHCRQLVFRPQFLTQDEWRRLGF